MHNHAIMYAIFMYVDSSLKISQILLAMAILWGHVFPCNYKSNYTKLCYAYLIANSMYICMSYVVITWA